MIALLLVYRMLLDGKKLTSAEIVEALKYKDIHVSLRSVERYLNTIESIDVDVKFELDGRSRRWFIDGSRNRTLQLNILKEDLLGLYMLKAHLKTFTGTKIENEVKSLIEYLETVAVGDLFIPENLYYDHNPGHFNYSDYDDLLKNVITNTIQKKKCSVKYNASERGNIKEFEFVPMYLIEFGGSIYLVAYVLKYKKFATLLLQNIEEFTVISDYNEEIPEFDYNQLKKNRYGIFAGDVHDVVFIVDKSIARYFNNRIWHNTQKLTKNDDGSLTVEMKVPVSPELVNMLLGWGDAIFIVKPEKLRRKIVHRAVALLKKYEPESLK